MIKTITVKLEVGIVVEKDGAGWHAFCPTFKGLHIDGSTKAEAVERARAAALVYILSMIKHGDHITNL